MNKELNVFTLRMLRDQYEAEHLDTEVEALDAAIEALENPDVYKMSDGTLSVTVDTDVFGVDRVLLSQKGTRWASLYYVDGAER